MPSRPAVRADDKRLAQPGKKRDKKKGYKQPRSRMELYMAGELRVADMDDEELKKAKWKNKDGNFKGVGGGNMMPRRFFDEVRAETIRRWNASLEEELEPMKQVLKDIALNPKASADARHKSAIYLIERVVGKVPEKAEVKVEMAPWEIAIEGILVDDND
jgi:hypothetical protein